MTVIYLLSENLDRKKLKILVTQVSGLTAAQRLLA